MLATEAGKELTRASLFGLPLVELISANVHIDGDLGCRPLARIEQTDCFALELRRELLTLDHVTPLRGLSPFKGVR
jgi:hypothetical protein